MMSELLKLKLEELTFDIAAAKCIAIEQSYKDVEALQGGKESNSVDLLSKSRQKAATIVWEIMITKVARTKGKNVTGHIARTCK